MHSSAALASRAHSTKSQNACLDCNEVADDEDESEEENEEDEDEDEAEDDDSCSICLSECAA